MLQKAYPVPNRILPQAFESIFAIPSITPPWKSRDLTQKCLVAPRQACSINNQYRIGTLELVDKTKPYLLLTSSGIQRHFDSPCVASCTASNSLATKRPWTHPAKFLRHASRVGIMYGLHGEVTSLKFSKKILFVCVRIVNTHYLTESVTYVDRLVHRGTCHPRVLPRTLDVSTPTTAWRPCQE